MAQRSKSKIIGLDEYFDYRGERQSRIETLSDAIFALAITLLVLSSSVPESFQQLWVSMGDIIPFGISITLIIVIWFQHSNYFLKYGLQDRFTVVLNTLLLFLVLVYVYPLKFLSRLLVTIYGNIFGMIDTNINSFGDYTTTNMRMLMIYYGLGAFCIFLTLCLMYWRALRLSGPLELNAYEKFSTRTSINANLLLASVPMISVLTAVIDPFGNYVTIIVAGFLYFLYIPVMIIFNVRANKKRKAYQVPQVADDDKGDT